MNPKQTGLSTRFPDSGLTSVMKRFRVREKQDENVVIDL
jgi:hypothetical protein